MASAFERWIGHMEVRLHIKNKKSDYIPLDEALSHIISIKNNIKGNKFDDGRWIIFLSDINYYKDKDFFSILFLGVDKESSDKCYADIKTLDLREIQKLETEGSAVSAHLCIAGKVNKQTHAHNAGLEEVEGLSRTRIINFLKNIIRENCIYNCIGTDGKNEKVEAILDSYAINDISIGEQLNNARLLAVDFIDNRKKEDIDPTQDFYEKSRIIQFRPTHSAKGGVASKILREILNTIDRDEYPEVRIKIEGADGAQRTARATADCVDALTSAFQKRTLLDNIGTPLPEATKTVIENFARMMIDAIS